MTEYYNRAVPKELEALLVSDGALFWLRSFLATGVGNLALGDVQLRADNTARKTGSIQIYVGSTSILEIRPRARRGANKIDRFALTVGAETYRRYWDLPTEAVDAAELTSLRSCIESYLTRAGASVTKRWTDQESRVHAGLMRHHGLLAEAASEFVVFDREVVLGHADKAGRSKVANELRDLGFGAKGRISNELDAIAVLPGGHIGLIELKSGENFLEDAAAQVAIYLQRFERLRASGSTALDGLVALVRQKVRAGLLPAIPAIATLSPASAFRPVVAMPGSASGWPRSWIRRLERHRTVLPSLQLWRVSQDGQVLARIDAWPEARTH